MAKSDIDQLLATARNGSSAGCKVTAALDTLDVASATKVKAALVERKPGNPRQWAYVDTKLAAVFAELTPGCDVTAGAIRTYRIKHRG